jgi:uncharacterized protein
MKTKNKEDIMKKEYLFPIIEPVGTDCNLRCTYCYYNRLERKKKPVKIMDMEVLENLVKELLIYNKNYAPFNWHGGEPTLAPIEFYERVIELQNIYKTSNHRIKNIIQTNGTLLNENWLDFFQKNKFGIGISIDGPLELHEKHRPNSFKRIEKSISLLKERGMRFGTICVVNSYNIQFPEKIYQFLKDMELSSVSIKPCIGMENNQLTSFSVDPLDYADFMIKIFNMWLKDDNPSLKIKQFFNILLPYFGGKAKNCSNQYCACMRFVTIDKDGSVYSCNDFIENFRDYSYGNICNNNFETLLLSNNAQLWNQQMHDVVKNCHDCQFLKSCGGGCTKMRLYLNKEYDLKYCQAMKKMIKYIYSKAESFTKEAP